MDTNKDYEHPVLGQISDAEVDLIAWDRRVQAEWKAEDDTKKVKINEIISIIKEVYDKDCEVDGCYSGCNKAIEKLEKFRDKEL